VLQREIPVEPGAKPSHAVHGQIRLKGILGASRWHGEESTEGKGLEVSLGCPKQKGQLLQAQWFLCELPPLLRRLITSTSGILRP